VLDALDDELLFAQPQSEPGGAAVRENLQKADALFSTSFYFILFTHISFHGQRWPNIFRSTRFLTAVLQNCRPNMSSQMPSPSLNGDIDPEYQRGPFFLSNPLSLTPQTHYLARGKAGRPHQLHFLQLLHPSCHLL